MTALIRGLAQATTRPALALLAAALLAGCGPTGGGTGTGGAVIGPSDFGARPASVCSSALALQLSCSPAGVSTGSAAFAGTAAVSFEGGAAAGPFTLLLLDNRAELQSRCQAQRFDGEWGQAASGDARYYGAWATSGHPAAQPAQLLLQAAPAAGAATSLQLWVVDAQGAPLLGPLTLQRTAGPTTAPPPCP